MRQLAPIFLGIAVLACKDKTPTRSQTTTEQRPVGAGSSTASLPATPDASPKGAAVHAPAPPTLQAEFEAEPEDPAWSTKQEKAIKAVAPEAREVTCHERQCQVTLDGASPQELVAKAEQLQHPESLRSTGAKSILLTAPETVGDKQTMKIYVRYDR